MPTPLVRFGEFELDPGKYELLRKGQPVKLERIPMELLILLVGSRGTLVTREMIIERLWGKDVYRETERGINTATNKIRSALCDDPRQPRFLQTVIGKGYRFVAEVVEVEEHGLPAERAPLTTAPSPELDESPSAEVTATPPASSDNAEPQPAPAHGIRVRLPGRLDAIIHSWRLRIAAASVILAVVAGAFLYRGFHKVSAIGPGDSIVLAEFTNTTGDTIFDGSLNRLFASALSQSPYISLLAPQRVAETLKLMQRPSGERLTKDVAWEVCLRSGSKAYIVGAISQSADQYPITLHAFTCETNALVASATAKAQSRDQVLGKLGDAAAELRRELGESLPSVQEHNHPIYQLATTNSLQALQAAELGFDKERVGDYQGAIAGYQRAVAIDPNFVHGYISLGNAYGDLGQGETAKRNLQRAYELRDRLTDKERLVLETSYYEGVTGETDKELQAYAEAEKLMPANSGIPLNVGNLYMMLGQYDKALEKTSEASRKQSNTFSFIIYENTIAIYRSLGRYDEAIAVYDDAASQKILDAGAHLQRYLVAFIQNDTVTMKQQIDAMKDMADGRELTLQTRANTAAYEGKLREARTLAAQAADTAMGNNQPERAAQWKAYQAVLETEFGNSPLARNLASQALSLSTGCDTKQYAALALARAGDVVYAQQLADQLNRDAPVSTFVQGYWLPTIRAAIALSQRQPQQALDYLHAAGPYELSTENFGNLFPVYLRGLAYLDLGQGNESAAEFQKFIDHRGLVANNPLGALAQLQLARAYVVAGDKVPAKQKYEDFIAVWKDADSDVPVLKQAEAEYGSLR